MACHTKILNWNTFQPCIVDTLDGLYIMKVGAGPAHTLYIARNETDKEKELLAKLPVLDQAHLED